jgi:hypothetical protein
MADASSLYLGALGAITAFIDEHKRCGDIDSGSDSGCIWLQCSCGGLIMQPPRRRNHLIRLPNQ